MYNVLIVNNYTRPKQRVIDEEMHIVRYTKIENLQNELSSSEFDFIYLKRNLITDKLKKTILCDFMIIPKILEKYELDTKLYTAFVNLQIVNKLIMDNISIFEFKDYHEEIVMANIVKAKIIQDANMNEIYERICHNAQEVKKVKIITKQTISRYFKRKCKMQKYKYVFCRKKLEQQFFNEIINNIKKDVIEMKELKISRKYLKMEKIKVIIADDDIGICDLIKAYIEQHKEIEILGIANTDEQEINLIETKKPDIVITDLLRNHKYTGLDIIRNYSTRKESPEFLVISADKKYEVINGNLEVAGYIEKPCLDLSTITNELIRIKREILKNKSQTEKQ